MKQKELIKKCEQYLGNRGMLFGDSVIRCAEHKDMWFIVFGEIPDEVEISFKSNSYECYDVIPIENMVWNKKNYEKIRKQLTH